MLALLRHHCRPAPRSGHGHLAGHEPLTWRDGFAVTVVIAAAGYPESPRTGDVIGGLDDVRSPAYVLHAGTRAATDETISAGGRVLSVTATGDTLESAHDAAYAGVEQITLDGGHHRTDIALLAVRGAVTLARPLGDDRLP